MGLKHSHKKPNPKCPQPTTSTTQTSRAKPTLRTPNQRWLAESKANPNIAATKNRPMDGRFWNAEVVVLGFTITVHPNLHVTYSS